MDNRLELQAKLEAVIGNKNVYFQPPASIKLTYPCVIYSIGSGEANHADDKVYRVVVEYENGDVDRETALKRLKRLYL